MLVTKYSTIVHAQLVHEDSHIVSTIEVVDVQTHLIQCSPNAVEERCIATAWCVLPDLVSIVEAFPV